MEIILDYNPATKQQGCALIPSEEGIFAWIVKELDCDAVGEGVIYSFYDCPNYYWFCESTRYAGKIQCSSLAAAKWLLANWEMEESW